jgi:predicted transcriptional regulator
MNRISSLFQPSPLTRLGPREEQLIHALARRDSATVRELIVAGNLPIAYTTVMTTLNRLCEKHLLDRVAEGRAFRYSLRYSPLEIQRAAASHAIRQLLGSKTSPSRLAAVMGLLDELQQLVEHKRRGMLAKGREKH